MKTIIAIDPGTTESAVAVWDGKHVVMAEVVQNDALREMLISDFDFGIKGNGCALVVEWMNCQGMAVGQETFHTLRWIGRFQEVWEARTGLPVVFITRQDVKLHHCGNARAKDANLKMALTDKYGAPGTQKNQGVTFPLRGDGGHKWQAFALATAYTEQQKEAA